jgi:hypothetical protein
MWSRQLAGFRVIWTDFLSGGDGKATKGIENKVEAIQGSFIFPGPHKEALFPLGPCKEFSHYYVEFQENDRKVKLQGIQPVPLQLQAISADSFMKWHKGNGIWVLAVVHQVSPTTQTTAPEIGTLLQKYAGVFAKPHSLPPTRAYDRCTK